MVQCKYNKDVSYVDDITTELLYISANTINKKERINKIGDLFYEHSNEIIDHGILLRKNGRKKRKRPTDNTLDPIDENLTAPRRIGIISNPINQSIDNDQIDQINVHTSNHIANNINSVTNNEASTQVGLIRYQDENTQRREPIIYNSAPTRAVLEEPSENISDPTQTSYNICTRLFRRLAGLPLNIIDYFGSFFNTAPVNIELSEDEANRSFDSYGDRISRVGRRIDQVLLRSNNFTRSQYDRYLSPAINTMSSFSGRALSTLYRPVQKFIVHPLKNTALYLGNSRVIQYMVRSSIGTFLTNSAVNFYGFLKRWTPVVARKLLQYEGIVLSAMLLILSQGTVMSPSVYGGLVGLVINYVSATYIGVPIGSFFVTGNSTLIAFDYAKILLLSGISYFAHNDTALTRDAPTLKNFLQRSHDLITLAYKWRMRGMAGEALYNKLLPGGILSLHMPEGFRSNMDNDTETCSMSERPVYDETDEFENVCYPVSDTLACDIDYDINNPVYNINPFDKNNERFTFGDTVPDDDNLFMSDTNKVLYEINEQNQPTSPIEKPTLFLPGAPEPLSNDHIQYYESIETLESALPAPPVIYLSSDSNYTGNVPPPVIYMPEKSSTSENISQLEAVPVNQNQIKLLTSGDPGSDPGEPSRIEMPEPHEDAGFKFPINKNIVLAGGIAVSAIGAHVGLTACFASGTCPMMIAYLTFKHTKSTASLARLLN